MDISSFPHWAIKLVGTIILFILCMLFGCIPLKLRRGDGVVTPRRSLFISLSNCFAGGVFFSTVILDLFPMVKVKMHEALIYAEIDTEFPMGDFLVGVGFLFMLLLEQIIHSCCQNRIVDHHGHAHGTHHSDPSDESDDEEDEDVYKSSDKLLGNSHSENSQRRKKVSVEVNPVSDDDELERSIHSIDSNGEVYYPSKSRRQTYSIVSSHSPAQSNFRTYILVFAISLHSVFEGLAVGLITKPSQLFQIYVALLIHKSIIAFSIGVQLVDARLKKSATFICLSIFSIMTPIGVALGLLVLDSFDTGIKLFFSGILQAIATGTFLYVTFFEVLPHELTIDDDKKTLKILFVIIGYALVTGVCTYENRFRKLKKIKPGNETVAIGIDI